MVDSVELIFSELGEKAPWELHTAVEETTEGGGKEGVAHPGLAEDGVVALQVPLDRSHVESANGTASDTYRKGG